MLCYLASMVNMGFLVKFIVGKLLMLYSVTTVGKVCNIVQLEMQSV